VFFDMKCFPYPRTGVAQHWEQFLEGSAQTFCRPAFCIARNDDILVVGELNDSSADSGYAMRQSTLAACCVLEQKLKDMQQNDSPVEDCMHRCGSVVCVVVVGEKWDFRMVSFNTTLFGSRFLSAPIFSIELEDENRAQTTFEVAKTLLLLCNNLDTFVPKPSPFQPSQPPSPVPTDDSPPS
jgi:hypothetical protein